MKKGEEEGRERARERKMKERGKRKERPGIYSLTEGPWRDF